MARGWKTKAMFSRYNVMNTARIRVGHDTGRRICSGQDSQRWAHMIEL